MSPILITRARVVDGQNDSPSAPCDILIDNGRIQEISEAPLTTANADVIYAEGYYAMPGLIDCHAHPFLTDANIPRLRDVPPTLMTARATKVLFRMLMRGFTTIRDAAGADWGIKQAIEENSIVGPRLFVSGRALSQTGGHGDLRSRTDTGTYCHCANALAYISRIADGLDDVRKAVRDELRTGVDQIKVLVSGGISSPHDHIGADQYSLDEMRIIVEEAERHGTYVLAHAYGAHSIQIALEAGVRTIEHANLIDKDTAALAAKKGAYVVPTLVTYDVLSENGALNGWSEKMLMDLQTVRTAGLRAIEICKEAGVKMGLGTDLLGDSFDEQSREFLIRSEVESPREIINSATRINAEILRQTGQLGQIAEGAIADILLINGNPLADLGLLQNQGQHMHLIMKQGKIFKNTLSAS